MGNTKLLQRDSFFDNFRAILIFLVVLCHLISPLAKYFSIKFIYRFCYIFHMPAMLFISGYFFKSSVKDGKLVKDKIFNNILLYIIFQIIFTEINGDKFSFYQSQSGLWYIQVLIIYALLVPVLDRLKPSFCLVLCFVAGLIIGIDRSAGHAASLSRLLVFSPFFMIGYYMDNNFLEKFKEKKKIIFGILGLVVCAAIYYIYFYDLPKILDMSAAKASYFKMGYRSSEGMIWRVQWYIAAFVLIAVFACLTPKCHTFFSFIGKNSLSVFILHLPLCVLLKEIDFYKFFLNRSWMLVLPVFVLIAVAVCFAAASKPFFWPFKKIMGLKLDCIKKKETDIN